MTPFRFEIYTKEYKTEGIKEEIQAVTRFYPSADEAIIDGISLIKELELRTDEDNMIAKLVEVNDLDLGEY